MSAQCTAAAAPQRLHLACGKAGLGEHLVRVLAEPRRLAAEARWRVREELWASSQRRETRMRKICLASKVLKAWTTAFDRAGASGGWSLGEFSVRAYRLSHVLFPSLTCRFEIARTALDIQFSREPWTSSSIPGTGWKITACRTAVPELCPHPAHLPPSHAHGGRPSVASGWA